jgi:hypothetical protein
MQYYNKNKLSLVGMQLPEKYKENFDASSREGPSWYSVTSDEGLSLETSKFSLYFQVIASLPTKACSYYWHNLYTGTDS